MGETTGISWTDHTFNPWWGCMKVSPGCTNCYAEAFAKRTGNDVWGPTAEYRTFGAKHWNEPLKWKGRVFCASMADVFDERGPQSERDKLFDLILRTPQLTWQLLTKRPENWRKMLPMHLPPNMWLGFTAESQEYFDERAKHMGDIADFDGPFFVSYEPAIAPLRIEKCDPRLQWLIFGGESGGKRRPMQTEWAEDIKADCERLGIAFFMKQMSAITPTKAKELIPIHLNVQNFPIDPAILTAEHGHDKSLAEVAK
jgi:protein gp37